MSRTHTYMQSRDFRWKVCGKETSKGACFALSAWWIIQTSRNASAGFWDWLKPSDSATGGLSNQVNQGNMSDHVQARAAALCIYTGMADQSLWLAANDPLTPVNAKLGCVAKLIEANSMLRAERSETVINAHDLPQFQYPSGRRMRSNTPTTQIGMEKWGTKLSKHRGYKFITIGGLAGAIREDDKSFQHAIAVFQGMDQYYIFDPNIGEFYSDSLAGFQSDFVAIGNHYQLTCKSADYALFR